LYAQGPIPNERCVVGYNARNTAEELEKIIGMLTYIPYHLRATALSEGLSYVRLEMLLLLTNILPT
jgi:hypothetical protein